MDSTSAQLVSSIGATMLNELRVQYAHRHQGRARNDLSGSGPAITISGVANFGGPIGAQDAGFDFKQGIFQVVDNFTYIRGNHSFKVGFDLQFVQDTAPPRRAGLHVLVRRHLPGGRSGRQPVRLLDLRAVLRPTDFEMSTRSSALFAQDDWRSPRP